MDKGIVKFISLPIVQVPVNGYSVKDQYSNVSIQFMEWIMEDLKRAGQQWRKRGSCERSGTDIYISYGRLLCRNKHSCFFNGCKKCYPDRNMKMPRTNQSVDESLVITMKKKSYITNVLKMKYICMWDHQFQVMLKEDENIKDFVNSLDPSRCFSRRQNKLLQAVSQRQGK